MDLEWALQWLAEHGGDEDSPAVQAEESSASLDNYTDGLPTGFPPTYTFLTTSPEDVNLVDKYAQASVAYCT